MSHHIITGDILTADIPGPFDAVLCDPPYGLSFMGKEWDHGVPGVPIWQRVYAALRPGAHVIAFGGTRTHHRLMVAIEDSGFQIRDCLMWLYGSGFPKSHDISKGIDKAAGVEREVIGVGAAQCEYIKRGEPCEGHKDKNGRYGETVHTADTAPATPAARTWQGYGTALKPAWEPAILAMKPTDGTFAANALEHGVSGLNVDGGRVEGSFVSGWSKSGSKESENLSMSGKNYARAPKLDNPHGRWPANVLHDGSAEVMAGFPQTSSGTMSADTPRANRQGYAGPMPATTGNATQGDSGSAARFFYTAKASRAERNAGLGKKPSRAVHRYGAGIGEGKDPYAPAYDRNHHPTVKPIALCQYLATLLLPPDTGRTRRILVPFSGSGSEMIGALLAGWDEVVGIELNEEYAAIAAARLDWWTTIARQLTGPPSVERILQYAGLEDEPPPDNDVIDFGLFA